MSATDEQRLPCGWAVASLGDLAEYLNGAAFKPSDWENEGIPIIRIQNLTDSSKSLNLTKRQVDPRLLIHNGDLLFSWSATLDAFLWTGGEAWLNQHIFKVECEQQIFKKFLYYLLQHSVCQIVDSEHVHGSTMQHINRGPFLGHSIQLPPRAEQIRIAETLDELFSDLDAGVAALERTQDRLKRYRASVLKAAVEGTLTADCRAAHPNAEPASELLERILTERRRCWEEEQVRKFAEKGKAPPKNWRAKYKEPVSPDATDLPPLPEGWCWTSLDTLIVEGPQNGVYLPKSKYGCGTEILRIEDFQNGWVRDRSELKRVMTEDSALEIYALRAGDLVINRVNSMSHLGKCLIASQALEGVLFESNMMRAALANSLNSKFIQYYLHSPFGRSRLTKGAKWAVNQASINQQDIRRTPIPLPSYMEQKFIVEAVEDQLSVVDYVEADLNTWWKAAQGLRQAILRCAFTGSLVPQDPNDEPASELLKRIDDERKERAREAAVTGCAARIKKDARAKRRGRHRKSVVEAVR